MPAKSHAAGSEEWLNASPWFVHGPEIEGWVEMGRKCKWCGAQGGLVRGGLRE